MSDREPFIALALSGGGARAMAFHLGCLRALHDRNILGKIKVLSTVSGGSVIGACWAYGGEDFEDFDRRMTKVLRAGLRNDILRQAFFSPELLKILATVLVTGTLSLLLAAVSSLATLAQRWVGVRTGWAVRAIKRFSRGLPVWGSLTSAFERALDRRLFSGRTVDQVQRSGLNAIINACDLRSGTAFRFGSEKSGGWRYGILDGSPLTVAKAVAASAAFPLLLAPLVETFRFEKNGRSYEDTVSLTDGGVFDNLGVGVLEPGRGEPSIYSHPVTHIISLNAGVGQLEAEGMHYWWLGRIQRSFTAVHRKAQDAVYSRLHKYALNGELQGFGMVYLGQQDFKLPWAPSDLVRRGEVMDYPTDFSPMSAEDLDLLSRRGEQLTHVIVDRYLANLGD